MNSDVTLNDIVEWQYHRDGLEERRGTLDPDHNLIHIVKALGHLASCLEKYDHGEVDEAFEPKRLADLIIHAVWVAEAMGFEPVALVRKRIESFDDGFQLHRSTGDDSN